jgi:hypothetical protein
MTNHMTSNGNPGGESVDDARPIPPDDNDEHLDDIEDEFDIDDLYERWLDEMTRVYLGDYECDANNDTPGAATPGVS